MTTGSPTQQQSSGICQPRSPRAAGTIEAGDCITARGFLVDISGYRDPSVVYSLKTSTRVFDEYPGGCEVVLVESCRRTAADIRLKSR